MLNLYLEPKNSNYKSNISNLFHKIIFKKFLKLN